MSTVVYPPVHPPKLQENTLPRVKRAVWFNRVLGTPIPIDLLQYVVNLIGCDKDFLVKFVLKDMLPMNCEVLFLQKFLKEDPELVVDYIRRYGCFSSHQFLLGESGNLEVFNALLYHSSYVEKLTINPEAAVCFVRQLTTDFLRSFIFPQELVSIPQVLDTLLERQDPELLKNVLSVLKSVSKSLTYDQEKYVITSGNKEIFITLIKEVPLRSNTLEDLINEGNIDVLHEYFNQRELPTKSLQDLLVQKGHRKLLAIYVSQHPLCDDALIELVKKDYRDILKLHYLKHGVSERVLMYIVGLDCFKKYINLD